MQENTDNLLKCMANPKTFFVSHPDDGYFPLDYERLVLGAREYGVALEVNNSAIIKAESFLGLADIIRNITGKKQD